MTQLESTASSALATGPATAAPLLPPAPSPAIQTPSAPACISAPRPSIHIALENLLSLPVPITYISAVFPARSETFVYREVRELRNRGWNITTVSLNDSPDDHAAGLQDLTHHRTTVYGQGLPRTLLNLAKELINHPLCSARTLKTAISDALSPGEPIPFKTRLKLLAQSLASIGLAGRLRAAGPRHIHCHFAHAPTTVGMYTAIHLCVPFSFTGHANDLFQRRILLKRKLQRAAFVACISRWHREFYRHIAPADDSTYALIRCGVDIRTWNPTPSASRLTTGLLNILTVCRLVEKKGVDALIRAMARFSQTNQRFWRLTVAGDGPERQNLQRLAAELGLTDRIQFLGSVENEQVQTLLASADIFVLACRQDTAGDRDGIPVVLMEAMAGGVPVIAGDLPAIRELIEPGITGLLVSATDIPALTDAITSIAANPNLRQTLAQNARTKVEKEFDLDSNISRLEHHLETTLRHTPICGDQLTPHLDQPMLESPDGVTARPRTSARRYALITPCRDEARYARRTLDSVTSQSVPPAIWVIVDDGSKDQTPQILAEYAARFPYIKIVTRADRGDRKLGGGVIDAFYAGYETLNPADYDYVCKLDLDLDLPRNYFESIMQRMEQNPRIGTASGKPYFTRDGRQISEMCGDENSVGMVKFYRTQCFHQIGGFVRELMWDGIDCHRCRMAGWIAVSWDDPALNFEHLRPMGTSHKNWWTGRVRHGVGQYFMGTSPGYMLTSAIFRMTRPPILAGGIAMLWGYVRSACQRKPRYGDPDFRRFLRRYQWDCLINGKTRTTERLNRQQSNIWNPTAQKNASSPS